MEATALAHNSIPGLSRPSPLLRLQSDEKLVALTRRGQHAAFETLFSRYQSRLLSFCRHMLSSKEDAEDVLQEVFTAAFNAILADEREINVRPWLYRIARNRSLNHLRRASAVGVDSMDIHFAEGGIDTGEKVLRRESFRQLIADVQQLPETQRTALLLREIDALSYEQIAHAMETTVPSVKSLLVRARISLAEAAEARKLSCEEVRLELGEVAEGLVKLGAPARRHVRDCERCHDFKKHLKANNHALAAIFPVGPLLHAQKARPHEARLDRLGGQRARRRAEPARPLEPRGPQPPRAPRVLEERAPPAASSPPERARWPRRRSPDSPPPRSSPRAPSRRNTPVGRRTITIRSPPPQSARSRRRRRSSSATRPSRPPPPPPSSRSPRSPTAGATTAPPASRPRRPPR